MRRIRAIFTVTFLTLVTSATAIHGRPAASTYLGISDLALRGDLTLAPPRILDVESDPVALGQVVGDQDDTERRRDTNTKVTYELQAEVLFAKDSSRLGSSARLRISLIAEEVRRQAAKEVRVFGFTDDLGSFAHGDVLAQQRAEAVQAVLADLLPSTVTFETQGFGERQPVASNSTEVGRRENRRVEISYLRKQR